MHSVRCIDGGEKQRAKMAMWLIWLLCGVVLLSFVTLWVQGTVGEALAELLKVIVPVLTTLLGSIIGFYYGSHRGGG